MSAAILTPRLELRPLGREHLPALARWEADPVLRDLNDDDPAPAAAEETARIVEGWLRPGRDDLQAFAAHLRAGGRCIGWGMLAAIDRAGAEARVGLTVGERDLWGQGLGREMLEGLLAHAFGPLALARVRAEVYAFNARSIRLLESAGFQRVGTEPAAVRRGDKSFDELHFVRFRTP